MAMAVHGGVRMQMQMQVQDGLRQEGAGLPRFFASSASALHRVRVRQGCAQSGEKLHQTSGLVLRCEATLPVAIPQRSAAPAGGGRVSFDVERTAIRLALPSKGRMAEDTLSLLKECQLSVRKMNPRQYIADIPELDNVEVWFQRASDVVRKLRSGDVDLGIVGYDMVREFGEDDDDLLIIHDALGFGHCHLGIGIPTYGIFESISSLEELAAMPQWTAERPLRIVTGYTYLGNRFVEEHGLKNVQLLTADGALEAAPAMGTADGILDLISSGTTLRENNLKEIAGGQVCTSEGVFVASRRSLLKRKGVLEAAREMLERLEAHLRARNQFAVTVNMRGNSMEEVARMILLNTDFPGLQGPTVAPVFSAKAGSVEVEYFAVTIIVQKPKLYRAVEQLRKVGGSGVLITPLIYIFDEEPPRWAQLLKTLGLS